VAARYAPVSAVPLHSLCEGREAALESLLRLAGALPPA
jgi:hypothetical protein